MRVAVAPYAVKVVRHWSSKEFGFQIFASMAKVPPAAALEKLHLRPSQVKSIDLGTVGDGSVTWLIQREAGGPVRVVDAISGEVW